jgi:hypothetical protein
MAFEATRPAFGFEQPHEGLTNDWWTPRWIVEPLGAFDLDPCAGVGQTPLAHAVYVPPQDGLALPWHGRVWCNPPYGPNVHAWADRMATHGRGILLIFARVETKAWRDIWGKSSGILFPSRRITFEKPDGTKAKSGTAPSALIAYGDANVEALRKCGIAGALVTKVEMQ